MGHAHAGGQPHHGLDAELVDAVMRASRVFIGMAAQSIAAVREDVTVPQFRALVLIATHGPQRPIDLASFLDVNPSSVTRLIGRLRRAGLIQKDAIAGDRRSNLVHLTPAGWDLVTAVSKYRREKFEQLLAKLPKDWHQCVIDALTTIGDLANEPHGGDPVVGLRRPLAD